MSRKYIILVFWTAFLVPSFGYSGGLLRSVYDTHGAKTCDREAGEHCPAINPGDVIVTPQWKLQAGQSIKWQIHLDASGAQFTSIQECQMRPFCAAVMNAFNTWQSDENVNIRFEFGGSTPARTRNFNGSPDSYGDLAPDGINLISFENDVFRDLALPEEVLALTFIYFNNPLGQITDADIYFNPGYNPMLRSIPPTELRFTTGNTNAQLDVESIALHEMGHFLGLAHSIVRNATMYPTIGSDNPLESRRLKNDDKAWIGVLYPSQAYVAQTGVIRGRMINGVSGGAFYGSHLMAFPISTADEFLKTTSGSLAFSGAYSETNGEYIIPGLAPGKYFLLAEGLDGQPETADPARISDLLNLLTPKAYIQPEFYDGPNVEGNQEQITNFSPQGISIAASIEVKANRVVEGVDLISNEYPSNISRVILAGLPKPPEAVVLSGVKLGDKKDQINERLGQLNESEGGCSVRTRTTNASILVIVMFGILAAALVGIRNFN